MTKERAKELIIKRVTKEEKVSLNGLTKYLNGRFVGVRALLTELESEGKVSLTYTNGYTGPIRTDVTLKK